VQNLHRDPTELIKAWAINLACQKVGLRTVAKFVETRETLDMAREIEIDYVQGFGIARPAPIAGIA
jgi:EAL domain-containing protein (putative c-di-GMP-specific phosphodiesterase class I)